MDNGPRNVTWMGVLQTPLWRPPGLGTGAKFARCGCSLTPGKSLSSGIRIGISGAAMCNRLKVARAVRVKPWPPNSNACHGACTTQPNRPYRYLRESPEVIRQ